MRTRSGRWRIAAIVAAATLATGCYWTQPGYNSHRTGFNPHEHAITAANAPTLEIDWTTEERVRGAEIVRSPAGLLHVSDGSRITSVDPGTGDIAWARTLDIRIDRIPTILALGEVLYLPTPPVGTTPDICIQRFQAATGAPLGCLWFQAPAPADWSWIESVASGPWIAMTLWGPALPGQPNTGWLAVVHTGDPSRSWGRALPAAAGFEVGNPVIVDGQVLAVTSAAGERSVLQRWPVDCPGGGCDPVASLTLDSHLGHLIGADATGSYLAVTSDELVEVVDLDANAIAWQAELEEGTAHFPSSRPTWTPRSLVVGTYRYVGGSERTRVLRYPAQGCSAATCAPTWTADLDGFSGGQIAAAGDVLAVSTTGAPLVVLPEVCDDPCAPLLSLPGHAFWGAPIFTDGRIFATGDFEVTDFDSRLVALRPPGD